MALRPVQSLWLGPGRHFVHYPISGGRMVNVVAIVPAGEWRTESWTADGSVEDLAREFDGWDARLRQLIGAATDTKRWALYDRAPLQRWSAGRITLLGDAAHATLQYLAQGACMALEDAVTLGQAMRVCDRRIDAAFELYQRSRVARTARIVLSAREMGRIFHAKGVERLVRNDLWKGRTPERFYDAMEWLYGWTLKNCLAAEGPDGTMT